MSVGQLQRWMVGIVCLVWFFSFQAPSMGWAGTQAAVQQFETPKGVKVLLLEDHVNHMVEVRIMVRGGSVYDPPGREGVASLTAWMFNEGGGELDSSAFQERLEYYGISLGATASMDSMTVNMTTLKEHLDEAWTRLGDALLRPRLAEEDFARGVRERTAELIKSEEDPSFQAMRALYPMMYGGHLYGRPITGWVESVKQIKLSDIRQHHEAVFRASGMVVAVAGDVTLEQLKKLVETHLSGLSELPIPFSQIPMAEPTEQGLTQHIEMDLSQTTLRMGMVGISREDPDYYPMVVMNQILGGGGLPSRLTTVIREKRGLAYGVFSYFAPWMHRGPFVVGTETKNASSGEVVSLIYAELMRMITDKVDNEEMRDVKRYLTGSFPLQLDGLDKLADLWVRIGFYHRGLDYLEKWPARIRAVTCEDIQRVATRVLDFKLLNTVSVGRKKSDPAVELAAPVGVDTPAEIDASPLSQ